MGICKILSLYYQTFLGGKHPLKRTFNAFGKIIDSAVLDGIGYFTFGTVKRIKTKNGIEIVINMNPKIFRVSPIAKSPKDESKLECGAFLNIKGLQRGNRRGIPLKFP